jgi:Domain of unknown function (DUF4132)/Poly(ADP-ribose) polymerase and DNA-Ligase Zn-finger region
MGDKKENVIERAKTARSSCKECGLTIEKGALRFGFVDFAFSESGSYKYYHVTCAKKRKARELLDAVAASQEVPREEIEAVLGTGGAPSKAPPLTSVPAWLSGAPAQEAESFATGVSPPNKDGMALDDASVNKLVAALHRETTKKPAKKNDVTVAQLEEWLGKDEMRAFVWRLFEGWAQGDAHMRHKWIFSALTDRLDDALGFKLGTMIEHWIKDNKKNAAEAGLLALAESGSQTSLMVIQAVAQRFHYKGYYNLAGRVLEQVARDRELSVHELEDRLVPALDLDADGSRRFDLGGRTLQLRVDGDLRVELEADDQTRLRGFPSVRKGDDADKVAAAKSAFDLVRTELEALLETQSARLEHAFSTGRSWKRADWEKYLLEHPVMKHLVKRLVWLSDAPFIVDEEGRFMGADLAAMKLGAETVRLVHPAELDDGARNAWSTVLTDFQIIQPFNQLARPVVALADQERNKDALASKSPIHVDVGRLHGVFNRLGWTKGPPDYMTVKCFYKDFVGFGVVGIVEIDPGMSVTGYGDEKQTVTSAFFAHSAPVDGAHLPDRVTLSAVSPVAISEVLHAMSALGA